MGSRLKLSVRYIMNNMKETNYGMKKVVKDFLIVFSNNIISLISGLIVSLGLPKILSMEDYSDYKIFMLYLSYIGLFHFGLIDGVVVKFAGKSEIDIGLRIYRSITRLLVKMELIIAVLILAIVLVVIRGEYEFLGIVVAFDIIVHNLLSYYRSTMQITMRYKAYTITGVYGNIFRLFGILLLLIMKKLNCASCNIYIMIYMFGEISQLIFCLLLSKRITFGKKLDIREAKAVIMEIFKTGTPLLVAGIISTLILNLDRQFVSILFRKKDYAVYSFSYSIMNIILTLISAMSIVLYPAIKVKEKKELGKYYENFICILSCFVFSCFVFIPILNKFIEWFLPDYKYSLEILRVIFPVVVSLSIMQIIVINFYKTIEITRTYLMISITVLGISFMLNYIGYFIFKSMEAIAVSTVISCYIWFFISDRIIKNRININSYGVYYCLVITIIYYISYFLIWNINWLLGICSYAIFVGIMSYLIIKKQIVKR